MNGQGTLVTISPDARGWYSLEHTIEPAVVEQLKLLGAIDKLSVTKIPLLTVKLAQRLSEVRAEHLWLWSVVTPRALNQIVQLSDLQVLDVLSIKGAGKLSGFRKAKTLRVLRANIGLREADLPEIAQCPQLQELGAQSAELSPTALAAMLAIPQLMALDIESTRFDDRMARQLSRSKSIESLDVGATRVSGIGLRHLVQMKQLKSLDLWATAIQEADLPLLFELPNLQYLSLGHYEGLPQLDAEKVCGFILESPSLKRVWLDGIRLNASQKDALEAKLDALQITSAGDGG